MKKLISLFCILMVAILLFSSLPLVQAETEKSARKYGNSFLLWVESEGKREYNVTDFPLIENLIYVAIVKMEPTEDGYVFLLLMALENDDLSKAKQQASVYGTVCANYLASDYADAQSYMELNHTSVELKVGETANLEVVWHSLASNEYGLTGIMFTVDPELVDETALVESKYKDLGFYMIFADENPIAKPWHENTAVVGYPSYGKMNQISTIHSYIGIGSYNNSIFQIINNLVNQSGVLTAQLYFQPSVHTQENPHVRFSCSSQGIVDIEEGGSTLKGIVKALQPGEVMITAKVRGGGTGTATATCKVTVVEDKPESPTDIPTDTPTDITSTDIPYGDVNSDTKIDAKDALLVLKYAVQKIELTKVQKSAAEVDGKDGINAKDALEILKYSVKKITKFPIEEVVITPTDVTPTALG